MLLIFDKNDGQVSSSFEEALGTLQDGRYLVTIREVSDAKTESDYQRQYFAMIDTVRDHSGDSRYTIHERFKRERKIETTTDFTIQDWVEFVEAFKWYNFKTLDLIL